MAANQHSEITITDPQDLRVLAHPARQRVIAALYSGQVLTASEAAELCGLSPSAMSYHLRALHRVGVIERDHSTDGRERPWRSAADSYDIDPAAFAAAGLETSRARLGAWSADLSESLDEFVRQLSQGQSRGLATSRRLWLTAAEEKALGERIHALWKGYAGRTEDDHPAGAELRDVYALSLPSPNSTIGASEPPSQSTQNKAAKRS